jgi:hypothetical protein
MVFDQGSRILGRKETHWPINALLGKVLSEIPYCFIRPREISLSQFAD